MAPEQQAKGLPAWLTALVGLGLTLLFQALLWRGTWLHNLPAGYAPLTGPLVYDFSVLTYQMQMARDLFAATGQLYGPDVFINGGYPLSFIWNSNVFLQTLAVALPSLGLGQILEGAFWLGVFGFAAAWFSVIRATTPQSPPALALTLLGLALFRAGLPALFLWAGMTTAALLVTVSVLVTLLWVRVLEKPDPERWFHLVFAVALGFWVHKTMVVIMGALAVGGLLTSKDRGRLLLGLLVAALVTLAVNWFWIKGLLWAWPHKTLRPDAPFWVEPPLRFVKDHFTSTKTYLTGELQGLWGTTLLYFSSLMLGAWGVWRGWPMGATHRALSVAWVLLGLFTVFGGLLGFDGPSQIGATLNHYRYLVHWQFLGLYLFALVLMEKPLVCPPLLSRRGEDTAATPVMPTTSPPTPTAPPLLAAGLCGVAVLGIVLPSFFDFFKNKPIVSGVPQAAVALVEKTNTLLTRGGGLLLEDSGGWDHTGPAEKYYGTYMVGQMPWLTRRAQLGGPYPYVFLKSHVLSPLDGRWLGRDARAISTRRARTLLHQHHISTAVVWSTPMKGLLVRAGCAQQGEHDVFTLFACPLPRRSRTATLRLTATAITATLPAGKGPVVFNQK